MTLAYTAGTGGTISGTTPQTLQYGTDATTVTAVPDIHYHFTAWSPGGSSNPVRTDTNVQASGTYVASFALDQFSVNLRRERFRRRHKSRHADRGLWYAGESEEQFLHAYDIQLYGLEHRGHWQRNTLRHRCRFSIPASNTTLYAEWTLAPIATTTTVASSLNPSTYGQSVTLTATVLTQGTGLPVTQGSVVLYDNGVSGGSGCSGTQLASGTPNAQGKVSATTTALGGGIHSITACYTGSAPLQDSTAISHRR